jgi:hypothetical protein
VVSQHNEQQASNYSSPHLPFQFIVRARMLRPDAELAQCEQNLIACHFAKEWAWLQFGDRFCRREILVVRNLLVILHFQPRCLVERFAIRTSGICRQPPEKPEYQ